MAIATIKQAQVLDRFRAGFVDKATGETVAYAQARLLDLETRDLIVVSVRDEADLAAYIPETVIGPIDVEVVDTTNIRATKVRPVGAAGGQERF